MPDKPKVNKRKIPPKYGILKGMLPAHTPEPQPASPQGDAAEDMFADGVLQHGEVRLRYRCAGDPTSPAVVLLHGASSNATTWDDLARTLVAHGFFTIAPDLRGHGHSSRMRRYPLRAFAVDVVGLLRHLGISQAAFVGHSLGGYIAASITQHHPGLVTRLVLEDPAVPPRHSRRGLRGAPDAPWRQVLAGEGASHVLLEARDHAMLDGALRAVGAGESHDSELSQPPQAALDVPTRRAPRISAALIPALIWGGLKRGRRYDPYAFAAIIRQLRRPDPAWWMHAAGVMAPTLVVSGGPSSTICEHLLADVASLMPEATFTTIPVGHRIHSLAPAEFANAVLPFLAAV